MAVRHVEGLIAGIGRQSHGFTPPVKMNGNGQAHPGQLAVDRDLHLAAADNGFVVKTTAARTEVSIASGVKLPHWSANPITAQDYVTV